MDPSDQSLDVRLAVVAAELVLPGLPVVPDRVIGLALDLLAAGRDTPGTVEVASLAPGGTMRDAQGVIRQMLGEQGVELPTSGETEEEQYAVALWSFGQGGLSVGEFSRWFYGRLSAWTEQSETDHELVLLLDEWERETDPVRRQEIDERMRQAARRA